MTGRSSSNVASLCVAVLHAHPQDHTSSINMCVRYPWRHMTIVLNSVPDVWSLLKQQLPVAWKKDALPVLLQLFLSSQSESASHGM